MATPRLPAGVPKVPKPSALHLFTNRVNERRLLHQFFTELADSRWRPDRPVLSFYGVGGCGKTLLLKMAAEELKKADLKLSLVVLDIDHNRWRSDSSVAEFFWHLRGRLAVPTPLFDYLYFYLWREQHPGESCNLQDSVLKTLLEDSGQAGGIASTLSDSYKGGGLISGSVHFLNKTATVLRDRARKASLGKLGIRPEDLNAKGIESQLASILHHDVAAWLRLHPDDSMCIVVDGFERVQSTMLSEDIQKFYSDFCFAATDAAVSDNHIGFIVIGREQLRWRELYNPAWETRIDSHYIEGISENDAKEFFRRAASYHSQQGDEALADLLHRHETALLSTTCEQYREEQPVSYHPYYLDLAYDLVRERREAFQSSDLGSTPKDLQIRFLRYLQANHAAIFRAFQCFALAGTFDKQLFAHLLGSGHIPAGSSFASLVSEDFSYVNEIANAVGTFRFHRLMAAALIESQRMRTEDLEDASKRLESILEYYISKASFVQPADCNQSQLAFYRQGMTILFDRHADGIIDSISLIKYFEKLEFPFVDFIFSASVRTIWHEKFVERLGTALGSVHPLTLSSISRLSSLRLSNGDVEGAEPLLRQALETQERVLGPEHVDTLVSVISMAGLLSIKRDSAASESYYRRALTGCERVLGCEHVDTLRSISNLAGHLFSQGDKDGAEPLLRRALEVQERVLGPHHSDTLDSINNLAVLLQSKREFAEAELLCRNVLSVRERVLGLEHPKTLSSVNNLGSILHENGDFVAAEPLLRRALEVRERVLGPEHRDTVRSSNALISCLDDKERARISPYFERQ